MTSICVLFVFLSSHLIIYSFVSVCGSALRCGIQFLGNLAVGNQMSKDEVWRLSFPDILLWERFYFYTKRMDAFLLFLKFFYFF